MSFTPTVTEELLFSYFAGTVTPLQKQWIQQWLAEPGNEEFFYVTLNQWEKKNPQYPVDVNQAIRKFNQQLTNAAPVDLPPGTRESRPEKQQSFQWYKWAAAVLLLVGISLYYFRDPILQEKYATGYGEIKTFRLPDGSQVTLNANSTLQVPRFNFGSKARKVALTGQAYFSVVHLPDHQPFMVQTNSSLDVEVLGTEFSVFARPRKTHVALLNGKVQVHYRPENKKDSALMLAPGDLITLSNQHHLLKQRVVQPENYIAWKHHRFIFDNTPLTEIQAIIKENYGLAVSLKGAKLGARTISGSIKAATIDEFLEGISEVLDINIIRQPNQIVLIDKN